MEARPERFGLDVRVQIEPDPQVVEEVLWFNSPTERKLVQTV